jgi:hypothetical protein
MTAPTRILVKPQAQTPAQVMGDFARDMAAFGSMILFVGALALLLFAWDGAQEKAGAETTHARILEGFSMNHSTTDRRTTAKEGRP